MNAEAINLQRNSAIQSIDDLSFTSRDEEGGRIWWEVEPPKTHSWAVQQALGRAYALEVIDLIHNPESEVSGAEVGFICSSLATWAGENKNNDGIPMGFFEALGEYMVNGDIAR